MNTALKALLIVLGFLTLILINIILNKRADHEFACRILQEEISGIVDTAYRDKRARMQPVVVINGQKLWLRNEVAGYMEKGDILIKRSGSLEYYLIRKPDDTIEFYQYNSGEYITKAEKGCESKHD